MALTDLLNKAKNIAEEKLNQHLNEFEKSEDEKEEDREKLLKAFLPLAPTYVQDIMNNKNVTIPKKLIEEKLRDDVQEVKVTTKGIELVVNNSSKFTNMDVNFTIVITSINLRSSKFVFEIKDIKLSKADESTFFQAVGTIIVKPLLTLIIESIVKNKIEELSISDLTFKNKIFGDDMEMVCDFSNLKQLDMLKIKLPIIKKSFVNMVNVDRVTHQEDGLNLGFEVKI